MTLDPTAAPVPVTSTEDQPRPSWMPAPLGDTIRVRTSGWSGEQVHEYPQAVAAFSDHLATGGLVVSLFAAMRETAEAARENRPGSFDTAGWSTLGYWVTMDDSGLVYAIEINRNGDRRILGASPERWVRAEYHASGYDDPKPGEVRRVRL
jgi:hypothetical protein